MVATELAVLIQIKPGRRNAKTFFKATRLNSPAFLTALTQINTGGPRAAIHCGGVIPNRGRVMAETITKLTCRPRQDRGQFQERRAYGDLAEKRRRAENGQEDHRQGGVTPLLQFIQSGLRLAAQSGWMVIETNVPKPPEVSHSTSLPALVHQRSGGVHLDHRRTVRKGGRSSLVTANALVSQKCKQSGSL